MRRFLIPSAALAVAAAACLLGVAGHGAGLTDLIDQARERLGPVLLARDLLVEPDTEVTVEASLRSGMGLKGQEGKRVQFLLGDETLGEVRTNKSGNVSLRWKVPPKPGNYTLRLRLNAQDQPPKPIEDTELLVAARAADAALVVVDLDKTVVASGFTWVLLGGAKPMDGAAIVLGRLAKDHTVVYLTHRPDFLGPTSKKWLADNAFPAGPVLTSVLGDLATGSGTYKTARLDALKKTYKNLIVGIGDKTSDAKAYADNGLRSILILQVDWSDDDPTRYEKLADELAALPETVQVVTNWSQVAAILFEHARCPKKDMIDRLRAIAQDLRRRGKD